MSKIKIITDSTSDIPVDVAKKYNISVAPITINIDGVDYASWIELDSDSFFEKLEKAKEMPKTAQATPEIFLGLYEDALKEGYEDIIVITISSNASGTHQSAYIAKTIFQENHNNKIEIIDSQSFSIGIGLLVEKAAELVEAGVSFEDTVKRVEEYKNEYDVFFLVDTLKYFEKGGRINKASLIVGTLLNIKPVLSVRNGIIESIDKFRGSKNAVRKLFEKVQNDSTRDPDSKEFAIVHASQEKAEEMKRYLIEEFGVDKLLMESKVGATVGTYTGPDVIALFFFKKR